MVEFHDGANTHNDIVLSVNRDVKDSLDDAPCTLKAIVLAEGMESPSYVMCGGHSFGKRGQQHPCL